MKGITTGEQTVRSKRSRSSNIIPCLVKTLAIYGFLSACNLSGQATSTAYEATEINALRESISQKFNQIYDDANAKGYDTDSFVIPSRQIDDFINTHANELALLEGSNNSEAFQTLRSIYLSIRDYAKVVNLDKKGAELGDLDSIINLANLYRNGIGDDILEIDLVNLIVS